MAMDKETPITKYLATLERRQAQRERDLMYGSPSGISRSPDDSPKGGDAMNIRQQLRFEDETFLQSHDDQSVMHYSPPQPPPTLHHQNRQLLPPPTNGNTANPTSSAGSALAIANFRNKNNSGSSSNNSISSNAR